MSSVFHSAGPALDGRYELRSLIGEGSFGRVYRGFDRRLEREVAVKVLKPRWVRDAAWTERLRGEARLLARLSDPRIVAIHDVGQAREGFFYVAELVEGESLAARLRRGPVGPAEAAWIAEQVARALGHAHACGIVHRDVKPANVLLGARGQVKLGDFGLARLAAAAGEGPPTLAGTPGYMAPEQLRGEPCTAASDLFSLGVVLREMVAGPGRASRSSSCPINDTGWLPAPQRVPDPGWLSAAERVPDLGLARIVRRALVEDPTRRYSSAAEMARELADVRRRLARPSPSAPQDSGGVSRTPTPHTRPETPTPGPPAAGRHRGAPTHAERTRIAPPVSPRRVFNPPERRRAVALVAAVAALAAAMVLVAAVLRGPESVHVPALRGLSRPAASRALAHVGLRARFLSRYDAAARGTAMWQFPAPGAQLAGGAAVQVALSLGPAPVRLPRLVGQNVAEATAELARLGLRVAAVWIPAPGAAAGTVTRQWPGDGRPTAWHSTVRLSVAEVPRWRTVRAISGSGGGDTGLFRVRGIRWRLVYRMAYVGTCTFIFWCDGPTADVHMPASNADVSFGLRDGAAQVRDFATGPGAYRVQVAAGSDTARWTLEVQDLY